MLLIADIPALLFLVVLARVLWVRSRSQNAWAGIALLLTGVIVARALRGHYLLLNAATQAEFDYNFEETSCFLSIPAAVATAVWLFRERSLNSILLAVVAWGELAAWSFLTVTTRMNSQ